LLEVGCTHHPLHTSEIRCYDYTKQRRRVAEKLGFTLEATIRDRKDNQGNRCVNLIYGLLRSEWE
ncbi:MAG: GNAT family N-acetyltransferase, partial [Streptococcus agalactiae]